MSCKMISIFMDTNYLFINDIRDYTSLACFNKVSKLIDDLEASDLYDGVKILLSELALAESIEHQVEKYDEIVNKIKDKKLPDVSCKYNENYREYLYCQRRINFVIKRRLKNAC